MNRAILILFAVASIGVSNLLYYSMIVRLLNGNGIPNIDQGRLRILSFSGIAIHMTILVFSVRMLCRKQPDETGVVIPLIVCLLTVVCHWFDAANSNWEQLIILLVYAFGLFVLTSTAIICCFDNTTLSAEKSTTGVVCETNDASRGTVSNTDTS